MVLHLLVSHFLESSEGSISQGMGREEEEVVASRSHRFDVPTLSSPC